MLSRMREKEFHVLKTLFFSTGSITQREISEATGYSLGTVNKICNFLIQEGLADSDYKILKSGRYELEQFRVRNAVILAAGMTTDTNPIAQNIPKGLYIVRGEILIERLIQQLKEAGIPDIYVVIGFRMDQFFYLEEKYGVHLVPNPTFLSRSNNGSIHCVKELLGNSYIIPNDVYFTQNVFSPFEYKSYYAAVYEDSKSKEAFVKLDDGDRITQVYKGGEAGWVMLGHSYLTRDYAEEYTKWLDNTYDLYETQRLFWEEIFYPHLKEVPLYAKKFDKGFIYEFDELSELQGFDNQFFNNINPEIYNQICEIFNSSRSEITDIKPDFERSFDILFRFRVRNDEFVFRYPSKESAEIINYAVEAANNKVAQENGVDDTFIFEDRRGYRISAASVMEEKLDINRVAGLLKHLREQTAAVTSNFDYRERIRQLFEFFDDNQLVRVSKFDDMKDAALSLLTLLENDGWKKQFSHNNISREKFRLCGANLSLTDWNFSGMNDIGYDIAALSDMFAEDGELNETVISEFMSVKPEAMSHLYGCQAIASYYKFLLGIYYSANANEFSDNLYKNWKKANAYMRKAIALYAKKRNDYLSNEQVQYIEEKIGEGIAALKPLSGGVTNTTYQLFSQSGKTYALRIPGVGTNDYINRKDEMLNITTIDVLGIMPKVTSADPETGVLIMEYLENSQPCAMEDVYNPMSLQRICRVLNAVHTSGGIFNNEFDIPQKQATYREHLKRMGGKPPLVLQKEEKRMDIWMQYLFLNYPKELVTCHIDPKLNNFLKKGMKLYLIDWEYSGMADVYFELANFSLTNNLTDTEEQLFLKCYFRVAGIQFDREKFLLYKFATDYLWIYWHLIKIQQKSMVEYNEMSWKKRLKRALKILEELEKENEL